jgi:hypothetical protein
MQPLIQDLSTTLAAGPGVTPATAYGVAGYLGWVLLSGLGAAQRHGRAGRRDLVPATTSRKLAAPGLVQNRPGAHHLVPGPTPQRPPIPLAAIVAVWHNRRRPTGPPAPRQLAMAERSSPDCLRPWQAK